MIRTRRTATATALALLAGALAAAPALPAQQPATTAAAAADAGTRLLRTPTVSARHVAFAYANNIWVADRAGGSARRLTSFQGETGYPRFSPDGRWIAFSADFGGNVDAYVVSVEGGQPRRLTWHPGADLVQGWMPDGKAVVFASGRASDAPSAAMRFWTVPAAGGPQQPMPMPRAYQGRVSPDGKRVAYRMNTSWDEERRNYRGGQNRPVWVLDLASMDVTSPAWTDSKDTDPVWLADDVYFISDRDGVANIWTWDTRASAPRQVTRFTDFDVKSLDAYAGTTPENRAIIFEQAGWLHTLDPATSQHRRLTITAAGDFPWMMPQWKDVGARMTNLALSPTGRRAAVEARGEIFTVPAEKGDVRNLTATSGSAEIWPTWSPDGRSVAYFGDKSGEYRLYITPQEGMSETREIVLPEPSRPYTPAWSPDGKRIAFHDSHFRLWLVDVASGKAAVIDTDPFYKIERSLAPVWSPDSRFVAYPKRLPSYFRAIFAYDVQTGQARQMTDGLADATAPAWDASGKYLWFLASTNYGLNSTLLDMSSYDRPATRGLYLMVLAKNEPSPLLPESDDEAARAGRVPDEPGRSTPDTAAGNRRSPAAAPNDSARSTLVASRGPIRIDFDGLQQRIVAVQDVAQRDYSGLRAGVAGSVFFLENVPVSGTAEPSGAAGAGGTIHRYQLSTRKAVSFASGAAQFVVSGDGKKLLYRTPGATGALHIVDADKAVPAAGHGKLNVALRSFIDPKAEFRQIFDEGWRNQRNNFYVPNMHGADWPAVKRMYEPMLAHVNHRADLNYLLDVMGAETAIGHSYVRGGEMPDAGTSQPGGLLGADFTVENDHYRITRVYDAESWNPELRAPLAMPGVNVSRGDYLLAVNGVELRGGDDLHRLLDGTANRQTVLTVNARASMQGARQVTVLPVANEQGLRTRAWVEGNRRTVDSLSKGRIAYVYVPNTGQPGYTSFNRYYFAQQDRQGVVVDERFNGGGSAADYIIDILGRDFDGYFNNPVGDRVPYTSPANGIWGPKVMIVNEMAGSGGDLMPYMFKRRKIGPLVGKRTWGGLVATTDTPPFVDGGSMIAPRFGFFDRDGKFAVENEGVAPDIDVENWPKDVAAGRDPQLERAVAEALRLLAANPVRRDRVEPAAPTWGRRPATTTP